MTPSAVILLAQLLTLDNQGVLILTNYSKICFDCISKLAV